MPTIILDVVLWLLALEILTLATLPLAMRLLYALPDSGYATSKILGLILIGYTGWITGILGFSAFTGPTLVVFAVILAAVSWWLWGKTVRGAWSSVRPLAIGAEATFLAVFLGACAVRAWNAPIAGQEKAMDFTFMYSLIRADSLPAEDLWLGGYSMPYYYFGYLVQSLIAKVLPIDPSVSYNLALATVLALAAAGAFGLVASLIKLVGGSTRASLLFGGLGAFGLTIMGNLEAMFEVIAGQNIGDAEFWAAIGIKNLTAHSAGFPPQDGGWWFRAARVIPNIQPDGIDEFPYFSFLLGDLHPHYMAIPLAIMIVAFACQELLSGRPLRADPVRLGASAIVLGAVIPFNTWDVPVFWGIFALALFASALREPTRLAALIVRVKDLVWVVGIAVACYLPYFVGYVSQPLGLGITEERTMFGSLFVLFGPLLVLALAGGAVALVASPDPSRPGLPHAMIALGAGSGLGLVLVALGQPTLGALAAGIIFWATLILLRIRDGAPVAMIATGIITLAGLGSILIPELIYLRDLFGSRMNTVFKFYYDAWILLALAAPLIAYEMVTALANRSGQVRPAARPIAGAALAFSALLILGGSVYPVFATMTKSSYGFGPTLDGMSHLRRYRGEDAAAIDWLRRIRPDGGIVEAAGDDYTDAGRYSTFAGMPTLIGWGGHEVQWRGSLPAIEERRQLARRVYSVADISMLQSELRSAGMRYIVVGGMEREIYGPTAGVSIDQTLPVVQQFGNTKIYELPDWNR